MNEIQISTVFLNNLASKMNSCADHMGAIKTNTSSATDLIISSTCNSSIGNMSIKVSALNNKSNSLHTKLETNYKLLMTLIQSIEAVNDKVKKIQDEINATLALNLIIEKYKKKERIDISKYPKTRYGVRSNGKRYFFEYGDGCTWYAFSRWSEVNGKDLVFASHPGNAKNWANSIDKNAMNCVSTSVENSIVRNAIAVDSKGGNHVVYIEGVRDGKVYYSEGYYSNPSKSGTICEKTIEDFKKKYEYIITSK